LAATGTTVATANRATKTNGIKNLRMSYLPWFISKSRAYRDSNDWQSQRQGGEDDDLGLMYAVASLIEFSRCRQLRWQLRECSIGLPGLFLPREEMMRVCAPLVCSYRVTTKPTTWTS